METGKTHAKVWDCKNNDVFRELSIQFSLKSRKYVMTGTEVNKLGTIIKDFYVL